MRSIQTPQKRFGRRAKNWSERLFKTAFTLRIEKGSSPRSAEKTPAKPAPATRKAPLAGLTPREVLEVTLVRSLLRVVRCALTSYRTTACQSFIRSRAQAIVNVNASMNTPSLAREL